MSAEKVPLLDVMSASSTRLSTSLANTPRATNPGGQITYPSEFETASLSVIVLGASGDLAKKKTMPALYSLFVHELIPPHTTIMGYARSDLSQEAFHARLRPFLEKTEPGCPNKVAEFLDRVEYFRGSYSSEESFAALHERLLEKEAASLGPAASLEASHRVFYLALPPSVFATVSAAFAGQCQSETGWNRVIVEKPFGRDAESSKLLVGGLRGIFEESQQFRIDHYLGKEMVQNMMVLRFANVAFQPVWNHQYIQSVTITFKEPFGTEGRGGYFDNIGIIRDVMQNHLLQVLSLVAMERPISLEAEDIRDEKVKVLRCIEPLTLDELVIGQYVGVEGDPERPSYTDDEGVPEDSRCATFATACLRINNDRWDGVPFFIRCGKALNERKANIRIQFREVPGQLFDNAQRNELVIRIQPDEAMYLKVMTKEPGMTDNVLLTEFDLSYAHRFEGINLPDAYTRLIYDVVRGDHSHFVRADELAAAWAIFSPVLHRLEDERIQPVPYVYGSRGPPESDAFLKERGFIRSFGYRWVDPYDAQHDGAAPSGCGPQVVLG